MPPNRRHFWTLSRRLDVTVWVYVASILLNVGVSSGCLLLYFKPGLQEADTFYVQEQLVEGIRAEVRRCLASSENSGTSPAPSCDLIAARRAISKSISDLDGTPAARSLGPLWKHIRLLVTDSDHASGDQTPEQPGPAGTARVTDAQFLTSLGPLLSEAVNALGDLRQQSIAASSETQWWVIRILILSSSIAAALCVLGLWFVRQWVVQPVGVLKRATIQLRNGDFNLQITLPSEDEMGRLGNEIARMARRISHLQHQLLDRERQAAASEMVTHLRGYMGGPLSEIHALAAGNMNRHAGNREVAECQKQIAETVSRFEGWLHELSVALAPAKSAARPTAISGIVSDVLVAVRPTLERHRIGITVDLDPAITEATVDKLQIEQALIVLVTNAAEASAAGQVVGISVKPIPDTAGDWELQVRDEGDGIPAELMERVFLPFFTTKQDGNGLGLSLARAIVHQHDGELSVCSTPGRGCCFTIRLPGYPAM